MPIPSKEQNNPEAASHKGKNIKSVLPIVAAIAIDAIIAPQYDSNISEPIPAISPTLSPTLSAITPGFLGSSSGIPASIFPTRSAPTSALLVKIPPPTLENNATAEAPTPKPSNALASSLGSSITPLK